MSRDVTHCEIELSVSVNCGVPFAPGPLDLSSVYHSFAVDNQYGSSHCIAQLQSANQDCFRCFSARPLQSEKCALTLAMQNNKRSIWH